MLPRVILHNMLSVDGRMDWLTPDLGIYYEIASRWNVDAILSGSETILAGLADLEPPADDLGPGSSLDVMEQGRTGPLLVVADSRGRLRQWPSLRNQPYWRDALALVSQTTSEEYLAYLDGEGVEFILTGEDHVDLRVALEHLHSRFGVESIRVDSGGTLNGVLLREGLADEISLLIHPCLVGGTTPRSLFVASDLTAADDVIDVRLCHVEELRDGVLWLRYEVIR